MTETAASSSGGDEMEHGCVRGEVDGDGSEKEGSDLLSSPLEHDPRPFQVSTTK